MLAFCVHVDVFKKKFMYEWLYILQTEILKYLYSFCDDSIVVLDVLI